MSGATTRTPAGEDIMAAERHAIEAEADLPAPGTPERDRIEAQHRATVAGLLAGFTKHRDAP